MNIEIIRNTLYKAYLEAFYDFCKNLGGTTADAMCEILYFEADRRAIIIAINSFGTELTKDDIINEFVLSYFSLKLIGELSSLPSTRLVPNSPRMTGPNCIPSVVN
uniref:V-type proton ATPase subunit d n=1 Tax=Cacopsylla melanoneura TaxID=428564 RepID=A0A8D8PU72_9HEMI